MSDSWLELAATAVAEKGWYIGPSVVESEFTGQLRRWLDLRAMTDEFHVAGVGRGDRWHANEDIRRDLIYWLPENSDDRLIQSLYVWVNEIRFFLNQELYAGLESFEGHLAIYPPGGFYRRHIDTFSDDDSRQITLILYLNDDWSLQDGGQLRIHTNSQSFVDIEPRAGTVVLFKSRDFPHEVLESKSFRKSFTGWFKVRKL